MGKFKELAIEAQEADAFDDLQAEFHEVQKDLLRHKYLYYVKAAPVISDYDYDMLELKSFKMAKDLGFRADRFEEPEENEKHHVHWMVDFDEKHPLWEEVKGLSET